MQLVKKVKCNFRVMGAKFENLMNSVNAAVTALSTDKINQLERDSRLSVTLADGEVVEIERGDVEIITSEMPGWAVVTDGNLTVALDLTVTPELKNEGVSREIVKRIHNHRKESGFEITDRIRVTLSNHPEIEEAVNSFHDYIAAQVLADELRCAEIPAGTDGAVTFDFGDFTIEAVIER